MDIFLEVLLFLEVYLFMYKTFLVDLKYGLCLTYSFRREGLQTALIVIYFIVVTCLNI